MFSFAKKREEYNSNTFYKFWLDAAAVTFASSRDATPTLTMQVPDQHTHYVTFEARGEPGRTMQAFSGVHT